MYIVAAWAAAVVVALAPGLATACPNCRLSREVRASVLEEGTFFSTLGMISLPIVVLGAVVGLIYRIGHADRADREEAP